MLTDANALIGTIYPAPFQDYMLRQSRESYAYWHQRPYPAYAFNAQQWPADKGPLPTPLPYAEILIREGAEFMFRGGPPQFSVPPEQGEGLEPADLWLQNVIKSNRLAERWVSLAEANGNQGAVAAKFSVDLANADRPIRIDFLDVPEQCRVWFDPLDCERMAMARIQFPYRGTDGRWYYFREEWTEDYWVTYEPREAGGADILTAAELPFYYENLGDDSGWKEKERQPNPFELIPVTLIRNRRQKGNPLGIGDCWGVFRLMDRIALTLHGEDRANQLHSNPEKVLLNGEVEGDGQRQSGDTWVVKNPKRDGPPADLKLLEPSGTAREYSHKSIDKWEQLLYQRVGISRVNPAEVGNKGNLSLQAFMMLYQRTIATSDGKREMWGDSGMVPFFRNLLLGVQRMGGVKELAKVNEKMLVSCEWAPYFDITDADRSAVSDRTIKQIQGGVLTRERGAERIARVEGIPQSEIKDLLKELDDPDNDSANGEADDPIKLYQGGLVTRNEARKMKGLGPAHEADSGPDEKPSGSQADLTGDEDA